MEINEFIYSARRNFSRVFLIGIKISNLTYKTFGEKYSPQRPSKTAYYRFLKDPNASLYVITKTSRIVLLRTSDFFNTTKSDAEFQKDESILNMTLEEQFKDLLETISNSINHYREIKGWSMLDLEVNANIDHSDLCKIENAKKNITIDTLARIAFYLGVTIEQLFEKRKKKL